MGQQETHNLNVTLKGYPKKLWGLFAQKTNETQQITLFHPKTASSSLTLMIQEQTYNRKCKPKWVINETLSFSWDGSTHSTHNTANFSDWLIFQNQAFSLVVMMTSITQSLYDSSQQEIHHKHSSHIYICHTSHILWENLQAYSMEGTAHHEKDHTTSTSLVVPSRAYKRLNTFAILSIASFLLDLNIKPPRYMNTTQRGTSSQTNKWTILMHSATM